MRILYFDCFNGASGDMILGALLDAGVPFEGLRAALGSLAIDGYDIAADRVLRAGVSATKFRVIEGETAKAAHTHDHSPPRPRPRALARAHEHPTNPTNPKPRSTTTPTAACRRSHALIDRSRAGAGREGPREGAV